MGMPPMPPPPMPGPPPMPWMSAEGPPMPPMGGPMMGPMGMPNIFQQNPFSMPFLPPPMLPPPPMGPDANFKRDFGPDNGLFGPTRVPPPGIQHLLSPPPNDPPIQRKRPYDPTRDDNEWPPSRRTANLPPQLSPADTSEPAWGAPPPPPADGPKKKRSKQQQQQQPQQQQEAPAAAAWGDRPDVACSFLDGAQPSSSAPAPKPKKSKKSAASAAEVTARASSLAPSLDFPPAPLPAPASSSSAPPDPPAPRARPWVEGKPIKEPAYARLAGPEVDLYIRSLSVVLGRGPHPSVDLSIGKEERIPRRAARIYWSQKSSAFVVEWLSGPPIWAGHAQLGPNSKPLSLKSRTLISISEKHFWFLLPRTTSDEPPPPIAVPVQPPPPAAASALRFGPVPPMGPPFPRSMPPMMAPNLGPFPSFSFPGAPLPFGGPLPPPSMPTLPPSPLQQPRPSAPSAVQGPEQAPPSPTRSEGEPEAGLVPADGGVGKSGIPQIKPPGCMKLLVGQAILATAGRAAVVSGILSWIAQRAPDARDAPSTQLQRWHNSIRHNLTSSPQLFLKLARPDTARNKGLYWRVTPSLERWFAVGLLPPEVRDGSPGTKFQPHPDGPIPAGETMPIMYPGEIVVAAERAGMSLPHAEVSASIEAAFLAAGPILSTGSTPSSVVQPTPLSSSSSSPAAPGATSPRPSSSSVPLPGFFSSGGRLSAPDAASSANPNS
eukprot:tig00020780_g13774.t1